MTFMLESRIMYLYQHQSSIVLLLLRKAFFIWMVLLRTHSTLRSWSTPSKKAHSSQAVTSNQDRPGTRPLWVISWLVPVSASHQLSPTTTWVTMMERISQKTSASNPRKSRREVFLMMPSSLITFSTLREMNILTMKLSLSTFHLLEIQRELLMSTHHRSSLGVSTPSPRTTYVRILSSLFPSWSTCSSLVKHLLEFKLITRPSDPSFHTCPSSSRPRSPTTPSMWWTASHARDWLWWICWRLRLESALTTRPYFHSTFEQVLNNRVASGENSLNIETNEWQ